MRTYRVTFFKEVCGDTGQDYDVPQGVFEIRAADEAIAIAEAKRRFCSDRGILRWEINAERFVVETLDNGASSRFPAWPARRSADLRRIRRTFLTPG